MHQWNALARDDNRCHHPTGSRSCFTNKKLDVNKLKNGITTQIPLSMGHPFQSFKFLRNVFKTNIIVTKLNLEAACNSIHRNSLQILTKLQKQIICVRTNTRYVDHFTFKSFLTENWCVERKELWCYAKIYYGGGIHLICLLLSASSI